MSEDERLHLEQELLLTCSKAQAINKYIDELEENCILSELCCKSQQENKQLKEQLKQRDSIIEEAKRYLEYYLLGNYAIAKDCQKALEYLFNTLNENKGDSNE